MIRCTPLRRGVLALGLASSATLAGHPVAAATFGELLGGSRQMMPGAPLYGAGPYAVAPRDCPPDCYALVPLAPPEPSASQQVPMSGATRTFVPQVQADPRAFLPLDPYADAPGQQLQLWSYGQFNATTDPFDPWGFSTPYMYVPWSTPLSGWANAATWNWWRERSGALPRNW